ncbi:unnamed protein product [Clonostachys byssicola]|uniref:Secretory component protein SHR3 n=1 Tax=Clonostachys byssicola TaxID=160290 RepID=A0A9N9TW84_9HYPO|nr:unnamed protein product [Clonostachys byssicola]
MSSWIDWSKTTKSKNYHGSGSFATAMIIGPTCFFLGILFAQFPYDFPLLWSKVDIPPEYLDQLEVHLKFLFDSPPIISRILHITVGIAFLGLFVKMYRPSEANFLFDGASIILYLIAVAVYISNTIKGFRAVSEGIWNSPEWESTREGRFAGEMILGREDSLKVLSASNTILALVLIGVLVLQSGQWYAEQKDHTEEAQPEQPKEAETKASSKKKQ